GKAPGVHSHLELNAEVARNSLKLDGLHFTSGTSKLDASGTLSDFAKLHWQIGANGTVDLREVAALAAVDGLEQGETGLQIQGEGTGVAAFDVTGNVQLKNATYRQSYLLLRGINATSSLHVTQDMVALPDVRVRLRQGGGANADAKLTNYRQPAGTPGTQPATAKGAAQQQAGRQQAAIHARIFGIRPETIFEIIAVEKYENLGFDTQADGRAGGWWK